MDGTPVFDIKPYLPYVDSHPDAQGGFGSRHAGYSLKVDCPPACPSAYPRTMPVCADGNPGTGSQTFLSGRSGAHLRNEVCWYEYTVLC